MLLEVSIRPPHVPEPQQDVQNQQCTDEDHEHKRHGLQATVLGSHGTVGSGGNGFALYGTHLVICTALPTSAHTEDKRDGATACPTAHMSAHTADKMDGATACLTEFPECHMTLRTCEDA